MMIDKVKRKVIIDVFVFFFFFDFDLIITSIKVLFLLDGIEIDQ